MFYQADPEAMAGVGDHAIAAVEEVETINPPPDVGDHAVAAVEEVVTMNPRPVEGNRLIDPDVIVIPDTQQPISANTVGNTSGCSRTTPNSRKRTR